mmetsp:Transcript_16495/g.27944  ORF Transcript_16495/g.27944 Transcript_16495/m.27944 type:complete len:192 (+) Transcript_16495:55-630(+)|eukprot:CAMPEP_0116548912 /NCGR_PEP_ID=MMETSP0397-20121206/4594_1 /TAXON_ID=216820 /ORGANISM="Cyclophora tenuis, Strain ECT3854" /LENGTH=191 /DNA_ID=CAMNT_0004073603 /DNA_START=59 /DNA_END=634 /DNA_ORIENTATION=+
MQPHCTTGNIVGRVGCILDYDGHFLDVAINYLLFFVNLAVCVLALRLHTKDVVKSNKLRSYALGSIIFVVVFQIGLCLVVGCMGISIVWCAMGGWIISERRRLQESRDEELNRLRENSLAIERFVVVLNVIALLYYAVKLEALTTVAHVCALVLGAILSVISIKLFDEVETPVQIEATTPSTPLVDNKDEQ